jgi:phage tail sheath protein FI
MAIFTPSESPGITVKEIDLTGVVPNVQTTTGAYVGNFRWGPAEVVTLVDNEATLVSKFASPDDDNSIDFHSAAYFLRYSNSLQVVREVTTAAVNSFDSASAFSYDSGAVTGIRTGGFSHTIKNDDDWDNKIASRDSDKHSFLGRYPGALGNSLSVHTCPADSASATQPFTGWAYRSSFDAAPTTSDYAAGKSATLDEMHVAVVDRLGEFTGTAGTVLETFPFLSLALGAKNTDGSSNYIKDVINARSEYVRLAGFSAQSQFSANAGTVATSGKSYINAAKTPVAESFTLTNGVNSGALTPTEIATGFDLFEDVDTTTVDFLIAPGMTDSADQVTVVNDLVSIASSTRKDCVVNASPCRSAIVNNTTPTERAVATTNGFTRSSYLIVDNNYLKVYDKYNDKYIMIPAASSTAGLCAAADRDAAPWYSPAGQRRGAYLGITSTSYSPTKSQRDTLYKAGLNPAGNIPGQGVLLFGDKTFMARPSAFDRINVRRLFLVIERAVSLAARNVMFEFNDEFTRAEFVNILEPFLREIKGRRGITDFRVVCDDTNNTAAVIDRNEFIASIFIKPARSINFVTLNFVAVRTGVEFEEVVGTV